MATTVGAGVGALHLTQALRDPAAPYQAVARDGAAPPEPGAQATPVATGPWPALFGTSEPQPPEPPPPPAAPTPPVSSLGFTLRGVVVNGDDRWAILAHPTGDRIVHIGDALADGIKVSGIDSTGIELRTGSGTERMDFPK